MPDSYTEEPKEDPWEVDPFGEAATIIRNACIRALANDGAMSDFEARLLNLIKGAVS